MAEFSPTPSQLAAMSVRGCALLVSAGAGSGKTRVLTERVLRAVCDSEQPVDLDRFLVISFTRAAAGELRGRLMEELAARLAADPGNPRLRRQSALCSRAQIGTIHSFCAQLLRENCQAAGLAPDFKILDEQRADAMKAAALDRVLERCYEEPESLPGFLALADTAGEGRDDRGLVELVLTLHSRMQCHARPALWAEEQTRLLHSGAADAGETPWGRELLDWAKALTDFHAAELEALIPEMDEDERVRAAYADHFAELADLLRALSRCFTRGWDSAVEALPFRAPRLPVLRKPPELELIDRLKACRTRCLENMKKLSAVFSAPSAELLEDMAGTAPAMEALLQLTLRFDRAYTADKRSRALVDYADLEHFTAALLTDESGAPTALARTLSARYAEVMVDEYQDVSRVQDTIFHALSDGGRKLFLVGDVKQSIYRFRLADPEIFNEKYRGYAAADPGVARRILLRENFRSRREILDGANAVFSLCMSRTLGDVDYNDDAALIAGADWYEGSVPKPELLLMRLPEAGGEDSPDKSACEAAFVARRIRELVESGATVAVPGGVRPMQYGDVAILLRSANSVGGVYRQALLDEGIPVGKAQGSGFYTSVEISTLLSALALLDNPHKDIPLIAVLRSPAFGFTPDELSRIRAADKDADLCTALEKAAEEDEKCRDFLSRLTALRAACADLSASEIVWEIIEAFDLLALCSAMPDGRQRRENLMAFVTLSESFEQTGYRGLHRFQLWVRALADKEQEPVTGGASASAVQILSIHKSKGLEFPVVFLCDTARRFNLSERSETVLIHPELGLGPRVVDLARRVRYPSLSRMAISMRQEREALSEEMRLLYVALTRAKERLFVTAALKDPERELEKLRALSRPPIPPETLLRAGSMASWMMSACLADAGEHFSLRVCAGRERADTESQTPAVPPADPEAAEELRRRLAFVYPHEAAVALPSKLTATELKGRAETDGDALPLLQPTAFRFRMPSLGEAERPLTAAERGVATHLVLQYMDFSKGRSREGIKHEIARLRAAQTLSAREAEAVNVSAIERLFASPLGKRMLAAPEKLREFRFSLLLDARELYPEAAGEELLLQGVVDCCLIEDDGLVIIDYKTDRVRTDEELAARAAHYRGQLTAYAAALSRILKRPVKACELFFLSVGQTVRVELDGQQ